MKYFARTFALALLVFGSAQLRAQTAVEAKIVSSQKIWDAAPYNAFTDLIFWHDQFHCVFREATTHLSYDGALRILSSPDGATWTTEATIKPDADDLREGHLSVTPDDRMLLVSAIRSKKGFQSVSATSKDGKTWTPLAPFGERGTWIWRIRWQDQIGYGFGYYGGKAAGLDLYTTKDGEHFDNTVPKVYSNRGFSNESDILFRGDQTAVALVRRDSTKDLPDKTAMMGVAKPPYKEWEWKDTGTPIGSPVLVELPSHRILACVRLLDGHPRAALCQLDAQSAKLTELVALPPMGDKPGNVAYPGMVWRDGNLYISYYAPENEKCAIYFAKIEIKE